MKLFKISLLLIGIALISLTSCSKDDSTNNDASGLDDPCETAITASAEAATKFNDANNENYTQLYTRRVECDSGNVSNRF